MGVLDIEHISKSFNGVQVLKDISLRVDKGEVVSIIGPSGSGKSTLLRCATLLERVDGGTIRYGDLPIVADGVYAPRHVQHNALRRFGLVFQKFNLFPHLSVMDNVTIAQKCVLGRSVFESEKRAMALLEKVGLGEKAQSYPFALSGGQQQRVSIARALAMDPQILFFDEPTSALDPELTMDILKTIRDLAAEHMTMVIVTHEIGFARNVSDRVIFMADGIVMEEGNPDKVIDNPSNPRVRAFLSNLQDK